MRIVRTAALGAVVVMVTGVAVATQTATAQPAAQEGLLMKSALFTWESVPETPTEQGGRRGVFAAPTATLDELEYHTTMLKPGGSPHPPHTHKNEELIIVKEGAVEAYINGEWKPAPTGSLIFFASMVPHTVRNSGTVPARYHVVNWAALGTKPKKAETK
jgi:XRE family transcriptional regulator, regulator of sulfur utilization